MKNSLILLVFLVTLTACSDRVRVNCERVKNKALTAVTETTNQIGGGRCG
jgi:hypothetical protein